MMEEMNLDTKYSRNAKYSIEYQSNYRLNEVSKIKYYFNEEIQYQQSLTNKLSKYLMLISNSIKDGIISHDEFLQILKEKKEYNNLKNKNKNEIV